MQLVRRTFCKSIKELRPCANLPPKVARTIVLEWRTPNDRDEKIGSSCIKTPQLGRGDNDVQSPQLKGPMIQNAKDEACHKWAETGPGKAQDGRPRPVSPTCSGGGSGRLSSVLSSWNPNRVGKPPFIRDTI
jgi:hypothetical protein